MRTTMCSSPRSVGRVLVIDYSSSARDVPSSTPTARCQTKPYSFLFPSSLFFSRSRAFVLAPTFHVVIDRGTERGGGCSPRKRNAFFAFLSTNDWRRVILQVHGASNRSHFPQTFRASMETANFIPSVLHSRVRERRAVKISIKMPERCE